MFIRKWKEITLTLFDKDSNVGIVKILNAIKDIILSLLWIPIVILFPIIYFIGNFNRIIRYYLNRKKYANKVNMMSNEELIKRLEYHKESIKNSDNFATIYTHKKCKEIVELEIKGREI